MIDTSSIGAVVGLLLPSIKAHWACSRQPFILGLSGLQGSGKSTWAAHLRDSLIQEHNYNARVLSLDDLYLGHDDLVALRKKHPENKLLQMRGQPGTHDEKLAQRFFMELAEESLGNDIIQWPAYDKSLNSGQGGRVPQEKWEKVPREPPLDILIFEGWCLGFQPLSSTAVCDKWNEAVRCRKNNQADFSASTLADHGLDDLLLINENLLRYCETFLDPSRFNAFLHLDTQRLMNVCYWRMDQERKLRKHKSGMSDEEVVEFVRGYMPSYELFLRRLQMERLFSGDEEPRKKHVRVVLDNQRMVTSIAEL